MSKVKSCRNWAVGNFTVSGMILIYSLVTGDSRHLLLSAFFTTAGVIWSMRMLREIER